MTKKKPQPKRRKKVTKPARIPQRKRKPKAHQPDVTDYYEGEYIPYERPKGKHLTIFDNPPSSMVGNRRKIWDDLSRKLDDPDASGLTPEKLHLLIAYIDTIVWLRTHRLNALSPGDMRIWMQLSRQSTALHRMLFTGARVAVPPPSPDDEEPIDEDVKITAKDFPKSIRDSAIEAARVTEGHDLSELLPYGVRIGDKIKKRA